MRIDERCEHGEYGGYKPCGSCERIRAMRAETERDAALDRERRLREALDDITRYLLVAQRRETSKTSIGVLQGVIDRVLLGAEGEAVRKDIIEPTPDECSVNTFIVGSGMAAWYPQMGGYTGKCIIVPLGGCFDVYVWHNGEFPFSDGKGPVRLHHCDAAV